MPRDSVTAGIPATQATDAEVTSAISTHESDTSSVHGITDTAQVALKNANNVFTSTPQQITADATGDNMLILKHAATSPTGEFLVMTGSDDTVRLRFGGPASTIGGWGFRLIGSGSITLEATNNMLYAGSGEALNIGSSVNTNAVSIGSGTGITLGFFGTTPAARQTGVAVSAAGIHAALVNYGLITA